MAAIASCDQDDPTDEQTTDNPEITNIEGAGKIQANSTNLILHIDDVSEPKIRLYNADGSLVTPQPTLNYISDNPGTVSVSNGKITANEVGVAKIKVSSGDNGAEYINVTVVPDTVAIPDGAGNAAFFPFVVALEVSKSADEPMTVASDFKGTELSGVPVVLEPVDPNSGLSMNDNKITATKTGIHKVRAKSGDQYLSGDFTVVVHNGKQEDQVNIGYYLLHFPGQFKRYDVTAEPVILSVLESGWKDNSLYFKWYNDEPDFMTSKHPGIVDITLENRVRSVSPGGTEITVSYAGFESHFKTVVSVDMAGNWGASDANGKEYNLCFDPVSYPINYNAYTVDYKFVSPGIYIFGDAFVGKGTNVIADASYYTSGYDYTFGPPDPNAVFGQIWPFKNGVVVNDTGGVGGTAGYLLYWLGDNYHVKMTVGGMELDLFRGAGDCTLPGDNDPEDPDEPDIELIYGEWNMISQTYHFPDDPDNEIVDNLNSCELSVVYTFTSDGQYTESVICGPGGVPDGDDIYEATWSFVDGVFILDGEEGITIKKLDESTLVLVADHQDGTEVITATFTRKVE